MNGKLMHPRDQLVAIMNRIYHNNMTTLSGGNLSIREPNGDIWITPSGVDKGKLTPRDIMLIKADGTIEGPHTASSELPFHRAIYKVRPDISAIVHAHPPALVAFSIVHQLPEPRIIQQASRVCGSIGYAPYALPGSEALGANIADTFAEGHHIIILENHGMAAVGNSLFEAFQRLETLDFCARTLIAAQGLGAVQTLGSEQLDAVDSRPEILEEFRPKSHSSRERELRRMIAEIVMRAYSRYLMISTEGVVSARVEGDRFLITPTGADRGSLTAEEIVLVANGEREAGKSPSRAANLHRAIYRQNPDINCVMTAQCPHATAYAITAAHFDSHTIPESYVLLRDMPIIPFDTFFKRPEGVAQLVSLSVPVALAQNDCVLVVGESILQAFDRLEVAEFSAKALLDSARLGVMQPIGSAEIADLETAFQLT